MSLEDLRNMGLLRPETAWDGRHQPTGVVVPLMSAAAVLGAAGCVAIALGNGGLITWLGVGAFLAGLFGFIGVNLRGIGRRGRRT